MKKITDIYRDKDPLIDIKWKDKKFVIDSWKKIKKNTNDITKVKKLKTIDASGKKKNDIKKLNKLKVKNHNNIIKKLKLFIKELLEKLKKKKQEKTNINNTDTVKTWIKLSFDTSKIKNIFSKKEKQTGDTQKQVSKDTKKQSSFLVKIDSYLEKLKQQREIRKNKFSEEKLNKVQEKLAKQAEKKAIKEEKLAKKLEEKAKKALKPKKPLKKRIFSIRTFVYTSLSIIIVSVLLFLDKMAIEIHVNEWYKKIIEVKNNPTDLELITQNINDSKFNFIFWDILFKPFLLIPNKQIKNGYYIIQWGKKLTKFLDKTVQTYTWVKQLIEKNKWLENIEITNLLYNLRPDLYEINDLLYDTIITYEQIKDFSDKQMAKKLESTLDKMRWLYKLLSIVNRDYDVFLDILWHTKEKKYLVVIQNNDEIRPTWWFMWSLATLTVNNWKVVDFKKEDVYAYEWEINKNYTEKIPAPKWLDKITTSFWLRDSNYFVNVDDSSWSIKKFLNMIDKDVDGVIYINQNTILDLLELVWPIDFEAIDTKITKDNFSLIMSTLVEAEAFRVWTLWTPKQILFDFSELFIAKIKEKKDYKWYIDILLKNLKSRDLMFYSFNSEENNLLWKLWVNWKINYKTLDFAYPVYTSIWGNKSDRYINLKYNKNITKLPNCDYKTNLGITRSHTFTKVEEQQVVDLLNTYKSEKNREDVINIQWRWDNKSYVRVLLPKNAKVVEKEGLTINYFPLLTVVDFYFTTRLRETNSYNIEYTIENKTCKDYDYIFYKQPGIREYELNITGSEAGINEKEIKWDFKYIPKTKKSDK